MRRQVLIATLLLGCGSSVEVSDASGGQTSAALETDLEGSGSSSNPQDKVGECLRRDDAPWSETLCRRSGLECSPLVACPEGYSCDANACVCDDPEDCGYACSSDDYCPQAAACDTNRGVCKPARSCLFDEDCEGAQLCVKARPFEELNADRRCVDPGDVQPGDACDVGSECTSATCLHGDICVPGCEVRADCPAANLSCGQEASGRLGCRLAEDVACGLSCAAFEFCDPTHGCVEPCRSTADCGQETCVLSTYNPSRSRCQAQAITCGVDEFVFVDGHDDTQALCFTNTPCWTNLDCEEAYSCEIPKTASNNIAFSAGFCARAP